MTQIEKLEKIKEQVEFYFSDSNLPKDKFLRAQCALSDEGYVSLALIGTFSRLRALTEDAEQIKEAIKNSEFLKVDSTGTMIRRITPLPEDDTSGSRTIYVKGFDAEKGYSLEDVQTVFSKFGKMLSVRIRRTIEKKQKPSCFVEFSSAQEAQTAAAATITFKDVPLAVLMKSDYQQKKKEEKQKLLLDKKAKRKAENEAEEKSRGNKRQRQDEKKEDSVRTCGAIVYFKDIGPDMSRDILKEAFSEFGSVLFVDFSREGFEGHIRYETPEGAKKAVESMKAAKTTIGGKIPELTWLKDKEEREYWENVNILKEARQAKQGITPDGERGGRGRGGRGGGRGRF